MKLSLPLSVIIPRKTKEDKVFHLNLNIYRNAHHMTLSQAKIRYAEQVKAAIHEQGFSVNSPGPFSFTYTIFPGNNRAFDLGNVLSIIQKFTDDALIELGFIKDDNHKIIREVNYNFGGVDKENPRCELEIADLCGKLS